MKILLIGLICLVTSITLAQQGVTVPTLDEFKSLSNENAAIKAKLVELESRIIKLETSTVPIPPQPPIPPTTSKLLQKENIEYAGAFRFPAATWPTPESQDFSYGGTALSFNKANDSLFFAGHDWYQRIGEIKVPQSKIGIKLTDLNRATLLQEAASWNGKIPNYTLTSTVKVGGTLIVNNKLIASLYEYYDADGNAIDSHISFENTNVNSKISGLFKIGNLGAGYVAGYMGIVPPEWQEKFGCQYLTGLSGIAIIARTSAGPALFGFDPANLNNIENKAIPFVYYPFSHGGSHPDDHPITNTTTKNPIYNQTTTVGGFVFPEGTSTILFIGSHGLGEYWYGSNGDYPNLNDPARPSKGPHAYPYMYQIWAYNVNDLLKVKNGELKPWEVKPYAYWNFDLPLTNTSKGHGGVTWNSKTREIYITTTSVPDTFGESIIHVLKVK